MPRASIWLVVLVFSLKQQHYYTFGFTAHLASRLHQQHSEVSSLKRSKKKYKSRTGTSLPGQPIEKNNEEEDIDAADLSNGMALPDSVDATPPNSHISSKYLTTTSAGGGSSSMSTSKAKFPSSSSSSKPLVQLPPTVWSNRRYLWSMCRPSNFPGVFLFHSLGVWLALKDVMGENATTRLLLQTLMHPQMIVVLLSLLLTSSTSMVVNDYYDNRSGVDAQKLYKPLPSGVVSMPVAKRFLYYMYASLLLFVCVLPGVPARLSVILGVMLTFWYTQHLKPLTWIKNIICAVLIALSPMTSGSSAYHLLLQQHAPSHTIQSWRVLLIPSLTRLVATLFLGFWGREMLMDINDTIDDRLHRVRTVAVRYGRRYASKAAFYLTIATSFVAMGGPIFRLLQALTQSPTSESLLSWKSVIVRRLLLASIGCTSMLYRTYQVYQGGGQDKAKVDQAVEEGKLTVLFILGSFV